MVVRVVGYEEEVTEDNGAVPNLNWSDGGERNELNVTQNNGDSDHHQSAEFEGRVANFDVLHVQVVAPVVVEDDGTPVVNGSHLSMDPGQQRGSTSQNFQAQLDDIDVELGLFDGGKENGKGAQDRMVSGVGDWMSTRLVKNFPIQSIPDSVSSTQRLELWSLKRTREDLSEERELVNVSRKKQAIVFQNQTVEADAQPRRQP